MRYLIRAIKYFIVFCVLFVALSWLSLSTQSFESVPLMEYMEAILRSDRGVWLVVATVVLSLSYPRFGFITRRREAFIEEDREQIVKAFELTGYKLVDEQDGVMTFRAEGLKRLFLLFEDEITVSQYGQWIEISGIRRMAARILYRLDMLLESKRVESERGE